MSQSDMWPETPGPNVKLPTMNTTPDKPSEAIKGIARKRITEAKEATLRLPDDGKRYSMLLGIADDLADEIQTAIDTAVEQAEANVIADRSEWYCRGISSVCTDLLNGKSVDLTMERASQRTQRWQAKHDEAIKQLTPPPVEHKAEETV